MLLFFCGFAIPESSVLLRQMGRLWLGNLAGLVGSHKHDFSKCIPFLLDASSNTITNNALLIVLQQQ